MKKILQAASIASASAAVLSSPILAEGAGKWYTLSAGIRGFYDDNIYTAPKGSGRKFSSPGAEVTPGIQLNFPMDQTKATVGYTYGIRWWADRDPNGARNRDFDQWHDFNANLVHTFSPRYKLSLYDRFVIAQEPEQEVNTIQTLGRAEGDNVRNFFGGDFEAQLSRRWSTALSYQNNYFDYADNSFATPLNRMEHVPGLRFNYQLTPKTVLGAGYQYEIRDYRPFQVVDRDVNINRIFGSVDHSFTGTLQGSARVGVEISDWEAPGADSETSPYADASLTWSYDVGSFVQGGIRHARAATDALLFNAVDIVDQEATTIYAAISHAITPRIRGTLNARYQFGDLKYNGAVTSIESDKYLMLGAVLSYKFNQYLSGEVAYYYDDARGSGLSNLAQLNGRGRDFERNRIFFGVRLTY